MASTQVNPTRMELTKQKKKLVTAVRGHKLLKDKRDELMRQFLDLVRENMELRKKVEAGIRSANTNFVIAKAGMSEETLNTALMAPKQEVYLETGKKNVMSVDIPVFEYKTRTPDANDIYSYGFAFTSSDLDGAVNPWQTSCRICSAWRNVKNPASLWRRRLKRPEGASTRWSMW